MRSLRVACVIGVFAMSSREELRAKAQELLSRAKAEPASSESLVYILRSLECDTEAEQLDGPQPDVVDDRISGHRASFAANSIAFDLDAVERDNFARRSLRKPRG